MKQLDIVKLTTNIPELNLQINTAVKLINLFANNLCLIKTVEDDLVYLVTGNQVEVCLTWNKLQNRYTH